MTHRLIRLAFAFEFLVALIAIFTSWSEIGGQAALDVMHWGWKFGLSFAMASAIVLYTSVLLADDKLWTLRSVRCLLLLLLIAGVMGIVTYFYSLQAATGDSDEPDNVSAWQHNPKIDLLLS